MQREQPAPALARRAFAPIGQEISLRGEPQKCAHAWPAIFFHNAANQKQRIGEMRKGVTESLSRVHRAQRFEIRVRVRAHFHHFLIEIDSGLIKKHVTPGSTIPTDELASYKSIRFLRNDDGIPLQYRHRRIKRDIRTNTVEGLWSLIKNGIRGVYNNVSPDYLQSYLDEYTFRYNRRFWGNQQFNAILERIFERAS
jgi:ISXO2-like transposase domain